MKESFSVQWKSILPILGTTKFVPGKSYNHCRRVNEILAAVMEVLHFRDFDARFNIEC